MRRVTKTDLRGQVAWINEMLARRNITDKHLSVEWAYGQPKVYLYRGESMEKALSPRLPTGQMQEWLYAFMCGLTFERGDKR